jgi:hypothetical protein
MYSVEQSDVTTTAKINFLLRNIRKFVDYIINYCLREACDGGFHVTRYTGNIIRNSGRLLFRSANLYHLTGCFLKVVHFTLSDFCNFYGL